jgi:hypothetical protein
MMQLRKQYPKLDMPAVAIEQFASPPHSPQDCIFAQTTEAISADLRTKITPCQFGGSPDCQSCGCFASMGLASVGAHRLGGILPVSAIFKASFRIGQVVAGARAEATPEVKNPLPILSSTGPKIAGDEAGRTVI